MPRPSMTLEEFKVKGSKPSERARELRRRRHRKAKIAKLTAKIDGAKPGEIELIKDKIRKLTPGAHVIFANLEI